MFSNFVAFSHNLIFIILVTGSSSWFRNSFFFHIFLIWLMWFLVQKPQPLVPNRYLKCAIDVLPIWPRPLYITATAIGTEFRSMKYLLEPFFSQKLHIFYNVVIYTWREHSYPQLHACATIWPYQLAYCCSSYNYFIFMRKCKGQ